MQGKILILDLIIGQSFEMSDNLALLNELMKPDVSRQKAVARFNDYFFTIDPMNVRCELDIQLLTKMYFQIEERVSRTPV